MAEWVESLPSSWMAKAVEAAESGRVPDLVLRWMIRRLCAARATKERARGQTPADFVARMATAAVATHTAQANQQHYEVPTEFFLAVLGERLKYSACEYPHREATLDEAERHTLALTCERAGLEDGMRVLDLGCGWGSFTSWVAEHYPACHVTAVSNSATQRAFIESCCDRPGWAEVEVITADAATFDMGTRVFDRVVSIEMFEHMRNWGPLFDRIAAALVPDGAFFQHVFCHRDHPYLFEDEGEPDWMARNFFSGGIMPSFDLPRHVKSGLTVDRQWRLDGMDYARTLRAWLDRLDQRHREMEALFARTLDPAEARRTVQRWRMFFMACEELFAFAEGQEWFVVHTLLRPHRRDEVSG